MESWSDRANRYREKAEEMRVFATTIRNVDARASLLGVVSDYEEMAATADNMAASAATSKSK